MDSKELEQKLSQVAEWVYPSLSIDNTIERIMPATGAREYKQVYTPNPQLGPRIVEIKKDIALKPCQWCNRIVNQVCSHRRLIDKGKPTEWYHECHTCMRIFDPKTGTLTHKNSKQGKEKVKRVAWYNDPNYRG